LLFNSSADEFTVTKMDVTATFVSGLRPAAMRQRGLRPEPLQFIAANTHLTPVRGIPEIHLYTAHRATGLSRLSEPNDDGSDPPAPYWAFAWGGGLALARHILTRPETVAGRRVLDLGAGSGLVAIAAAKAGAGTVIAAEIDPYGLAAIGLNAAANGVTLTINGDDLAAGAPLDVDLVLAGDVFYAANVGARMLPFLDRCAAAGTEVLVGDPGRRDLPRARLRRIAEYPVGDFGEPERPAFVFALQ
jgi:predicted nicotinamide N-methyase